MITRDIGARARARKLKAEPLPETYLIPNGGFTTAELEVALVAITPEPEPGPQVDV